MSERKMIIANEECDFIVRNYEAIQALKACEERAKQKLPQWLRGKLNQILNSRLDGNWHIDEDEDKDGYYVNIINEPYYKDDYDVGYYFGIESLTLKELAADIEDDGCWVYLYCDFSGKRKPVWKKWNNTVKKKIKDSKPEIAGLGYQIFPDDEDDSVLVSKWIMDELSLKTLAQDPEDSLKRTADTVMRFIKNVSKYLVELPEI